MEAYLSSTIEKLRSNNYADLNLVIGNESCDLDSAICAVVYAAFQHWQYMQIKCKVCTRVHRDQSTCKDDIFVPILNVDREDFNIKTEVKFCLQEHGIDERTLVFRNDLDLQGLVSSKRTSVVLVDHHVLAPKDKFLTQYVTEVIDHRPVDKTGWGYSKKGRPKKSWMDCVKNDMRVMGVSVEVTAGRDEWKKQTFCADPSYKDDTRATIIVVGSCCTLISQRIKDLSALVAKEEDFFRTYQQCTDLLHCGIILDTVNFSKEVNKATPQDEEMTLFLEGILRPNNYYEEERKCKLDRLVEARKDVSSLTTAQLLKKDLKVVADILVPSFPILVEEFLAKPDAMQSLRDALVKRECTLVLMLGMSLVNGLKRDVGIFSFDHPDKAVSLAKHLESWSSPNLNLLQSTPPASAQPAVFMKQGNLGASRKQYMPAINDWLTSGKKEHALHIE